MRVLVLGGGGREHALVWRLSREGCTVASMPGNPGIADLAECFPGNPSLPSEVVARAKDWAADLVVVGPEAPLIAGVADALRAEGISVFGPDASVARLEGSKAYSKQVMAAAGVPTAQGASFDDFGLAREYLRQRWEAGYQVVVKASGQALGKGVTVAAEFDEALEALERSLVHREFGDEGSTVVLEDRLVGREFSLLAICNGSDCLSLPVAQDHKRALDGDQGPNTGGMGTYSPVAWVRDDWVREAEDRVVRPVLRHLSDLGHPYVGCLFAGLMVANDQLFCLEYNVRFGDPETQSVLPRLAGSFAEALQACANRAPLPRISANDDAAVTVVVASEGYPGPVQKGRPIELTQLGEGQILFHAGTANVDGALVTSGGRVFGATGVASTLSEAKDRAYRLAEAIRFDGAWFRTDIA